MSKQEVYCIPNNWTNKNWDKVKIFKAGLFEVDIPRGVFLYDLNTAEDIGACFYHPDEQVVKDRLNQLIKEEKEKNQVITEKNSLVAEFERELRVLLNKYEFELSLEREEDSAEVWILDINTGYMIAESSIIY